MSSELIRYGMQRKSIVKRCDKGITEWLDSIEDEAVRNAASDGVILTGGAIASMLLGETVNDFDLYFKDKATTLAVANYYADKFNGANPDFDVQVQVGDDRIRFFIPSAGVAAEKGASVDEDTGGVEHAQSEDKIRFRPVFISPNAVTLSDKVQLIVRFYGDVEEIHKNFDFTHATGSYDHATKDLRTSVEQLESLLSRTLRYQGSLYPIASVFRAKKFIQRGWRVNAGQYLKMSFQINELDLGDIEVLNDQLTGVDAIYMQAFVDAVRSVPAEKMNSTYVCAVIDRIFDGSMDDQENAQ